LPDALHATAFLVNGNQQLGALAANFGAQPADLRSVFHVAGKQNDAAYRRFAQQARLGSAKAWPFKVKHDRA
jgi:hypothetical protein